MAHQYRRRWAEFKRLLTASDEELYAESVRAESAGEGSRNCDALQRGMLVKVSGRITTVTFTPVASMPVLEAELYDGTSTVVLAWLGRRRIVGIEPGRRLNAAGRVSLGDDDRRVIYNPWYEIAEACA